MRRRVLVILAGLALGACTSNLYASCEVCVYHNMINGYFGWCVPAKDGDNGVTQCMDEDPMMTGPDCFEAGDYCTVVTVHGGGGAGGGTCAPRPSGCPPECFSCGSP